jgi:hypothetical protein
MQKPLHKSWISSRLPERDDADSNGRVYVADSPEYPDYSFTISQWDKVESSQVWAHTDTYPDDCAPLKFASLTRTITPGLNTVYLDAIAEDGSAWWARVSLSDGTPTKWKQHSPLKG